MTKTTQKAHRSVLGGTTLAILSFLAVFLIAFSAYADVSATRERGTSGRTITPPPPAPPSPVPAPVPPSSNPSGGITNTTTGAVDSGNNTGGTVTTGDEHVDVSVVNIGPTNNSTSVVTPSPTPPAPTCDPRTRTGCGTQDGGRTR